MQTRTTDRILGLYNGHIISEGLIGLRPLLTNIFAALKAKATANINTATDLAIYSEYLGSVHVDFKLTAVMHVLSSTNEILVRYTVSGPYGSHIDGDLIWVEQSDELEEDVDIYCDGITAYSTLARVALFLNEIATDITGTGTTLATEHVKILK